MSRLESAVDQGLLFYRTLAVAASELSGGKPAVVELTDADDRRGEGPSTRYVRFPELRVSLQVDAEPPDDDSAPSELGMLIQHVRPLILRSQCHRALRHAEARMQAFESRAVHDLRAHLQPLVLHVSNLRDEASPSAEDLELLDDLTRSLTSWVEKELQSGDLVGEGGQPITSGTERSDLRAALREVLSEEDRGRQTIDLPERLPALAIDRPSLDAGLKELLRTARGDPSTLEVCRCGDGSVEIRTGMEETPEDPMASARSVPDDPEYPPVTGGLLNLTAGMGGRLRLEASSGTCERIAVRLPGTAPEE